MLPKDASLLFSVINTKLRDFYGSLEELCDDLEEDPEEIEGILKTAGYEYDANRNQFVSSRGR